MKANLPDGKCRLSWLILCALALAFLACSGTEEVTPSTRYRIAPSATYETTLVVDIEGCQWRRVRLMYLASGVNELAYGWEQEEASSEQTGLKANVTTTLPRIMKTEEWDEGVLRSATTAPIPPGKLELLINDQKVGEFLPTEVSQKHMKFEVTYVCAKLSASTHASE